MAASRPGSGSGSYTNRYAWLDESESGPAAGGGGGAAAPSRTASRRKRPKGDQRQSSGAVPKLGKPVGVSNKEAEAPMRGARADGATGHGGYFELRVPLDTPQGRYLPHSAAAELFPSSSISSPQRSNAGFGSEHGPLPTISAHSHADALDPSGLLALTRKATYSSLPPSPDGTMLARELLPGFRLPRDTAALRPASMVDLGELGVQLAEVDAQALERELGLLNAGAAAVAGADVEYAGDWKDTLSPSVDGVEERLRFRATSLPPESFLVAMHQRHEDEREGIDRRDSDEDDQIYQDVEAADWTMDEQRTSAPLRLAADEPFTPRLGSAPAENDKDRDRDDDRLHPHSHVLLPAMERTPSSFRRKSPARPQIGRAQTSRTSPAQGHGHNLLHRFNSHTGRFGDAAQGHGQGQPARTAQRQSAGEGESHALQEPARHASCPRPFSLWELLLEDVTDADGPGAPNYLVDGKWERISNFLAIPLAIERVTLLGSLFCLDALLYNFTVLPIRVTFAVFSFGREIVWRRQVRLPHIPQIQVIMKALLLVIPTVVLLYATDMSKMYHGVRGQDTIKLYVIFNVLEIADRLCCAFGQDIMDTLFAKATLDPEVWRRPAQPVGKSNAKQERIRGRKRERARPFFFFFLALAYVHLHAIVSLYQLVSLNVAINSYDNALLTLLVSNQFVEIKGSVFKKFDKENLFQITCADIVERFQLALMLSVIAVRNMVEMSGSDFAFLPKSFIRGTNLIETIWSPVLVVILCEMLVDWLKHGFITKFNHVRASGYERYSDVLCKDVMVAAGYGRSGIGRDSRRRHASFVDQSPLITRRLGFASIPLSCLVIRTAGQGLYSVYRSLSAEDKDILSTIAAEAGSVPAADAISRIGFLILKWGGFALGLIIAWICLVALKMALGIQLLRHASARMAGMEDREAADRINDFGRAPIGDSEREKAYSKAVAQHLNNAQDDLPPYPPMIKRVDLPEEQAVAKGTRPKWRLEDVERWTMVKRIF